MTSPLPSNATALPADLETAHAEITSLRGQVAEIDVLRGQVAEMEVLRGQAAEMEVLRAQLVGHERRIRTLQAKLDELARRVFGKKSEKLDPRQLRLALDLLASAVELSPEGEPIESDSGESLPPSPRKK